jgi:hypothetical protein
MLNENERQLLSKILYHGGFCTVSLAASFLEATSAQARTILTRLVDLGYMRRVFLLRAHDATSYYQVTRKAGRLLSNPHPNCARNNPEDAQILRGLARFWFATQPHPNTELLASDQIAGGEFLARELPLPRSWPTGDSFLLSTTGDLHIYAFPSPAQPLDLQIKSAFLRYADSLDAVRIGFVIERARAEGLEQILTEIVGAPLAQTQAQAPLLADLQRQFSTASALEKLALQQQINTLSSNQNPAQSEQKTELARLVLPSIVHDLF